MAALLIPPQKFGYNAGSQQATAPVSNAGWDPAGLVWRSSGLSGVYATLTTAGAPLDTLALYGTNLRASDTVRVRGASDAAMTTPVFDVTVAAWSGVAPVRGALTLVKLASPVTVAFVRIDITSTGNPAGYVEVQRIVLGQRVSCDGVDVGVEHSLNGGSQVDDILGSSSIDAGRVRDAWKASISNIKEADYWSTWYSFLRTVGDFAGFLFVPEDDSTLIQNEAVFARASSAAKGTYRSGDLVALDLQLLQI